MPVLSDEECREYASLAFTQGSVRLTAVTLTEDDIYGIYKNIFGGAK